MHASYIAVGITVLVVGATPALSPAQSDQGGDGARAVGEQAVSKAHPLFDGRTFDGWEGNTDTAFRIEDGAIVGGNLKQGLPHNEFLCTRREFADFELRLKAKLLC